MKFVVYCNLKLFVLLLSITFKYGLTKGQDSTIKAYHTTVPKSPTTKSPQAQNFPANNLTTTKSNTTASPAQNFPANNLTTTNSNKTASQVQNGTTLSSVSKASKVQNGTALSSSSTSRTSNGQTGTLFLLSTESNDQKGKAFSSISTTSKVSEDLTNELYGSAMVGIPSPEVTKPSQFNRDFKDENHRGLWADSENFGQFNPDFKDENYRGKWADSENFDESSYNNELQNPPIYEGSPRDRFNYDEIEGRAKKYPEGEDESMPKPKNHPHGKSNHPSPGFSVDKGDNTGDPEASLKPFGKDTSNDIDAQSGASGLTNYMRGLEWHMLICLFILYEVCYEVFRVL